MSKYFCILLAVLLVIFFALGNTGFTLREKLYSSEVWFYDFSRSNDWGRNVIVSFERLTFLPSAISKLFYKIFGGSITSLDCDCYDFSGDPINLDRLAPTTMCRVLTFRDGTHLVYVGSGAKSASYVIYCDSPYLNFEKGQRIDTFTNQFLYKFFGHFKLKDIRVYDSNGIKYLYNDDGSIRTIGDYFSDSKLLYTSGILKDITILEAEDICGASIVAHGGGGGNF